MENYMGWTITSHIDPCLDYTDQYGYCTQTRVYVAKKDGQEDLEEMDSVLCLKDKIRSIEALATSR